ncbi:MAG: hypothetical protein ACR2M0_11155 [Chloroflexia bacterium]
MQPINTTLRNLLLAGAIGIPIIAGAASLTLTGNVSAAAVATPTAQAAPAQPGTNPPAAVPGQGNGGDLDGPGGHGPGGFGPGGPGGRGHDGFGPGGATTTVDGANRAITRATSTITSVKSDLAYATGKMDTGSVQTWLNSADALVKTAQTAVTSQQYAQAGADAGAADALARVADTVMAQALGRDKLPSASQNNGRTPPTPPTPTQATTSRQLARTYTNLELQGLQLKQAANSGDAATYLTAAQNAYKTAYAAYQAGKYSDAANSAMLADQLGHVADAMLHAASAGTSPDAPVAVPAPNF